MGICLENDSVLRMADEAIGCPERNDDMLKWRKKKQKAEGRVGDLKGHCQIAFSAGSGKLEPSWKTKSATEQ
jgi:hypothetical protein